MTYRAVLVALLAPVALLSQSKSVDWPVYGGTTDNTHYSTLDQITPANVKQLQVAWTYETHDEFAGSEMQSNPIVVDGVLYATSPKLRRTSLIIAASGRVRDGCTRLVSNTAQRPRAQSSHIDVPVKPV